ncbi:MAG: hypothetical protein ACXIU7_10675 [Roseinatronobacter sp.]
MTTQLDQGLESLKTIAQQQTVTYRTSRDQLHQAIVDAYLWWREADREAKYLENKYKDAGIKTRKRGGNSPNFYPLVRLVWNIDITKQAGTVSNWARSLQALHEEFTDKQELYSKNARSDLINYIKDEGGLGGVRGEKSITAADLEAEEAAGIQSEQRGRPKFTAPAPANVAASKLEAVKAINAKATVPNFPTAVTNADNLVVMLGRRNAAGQIEIVGSGYSDQLVQTALDVCTELDRSSVTPSLRLIAEALEPHALPAKLEKYRKKFFDDSEVERQVKLKELDENGNPKTKIELVKQATRLRYRPSSKDFLISKAASEASLVTYAKPKKPFSCSDEVILRGQDRAWIEQELLNLQKLTLYKAEPESGLANAADSIKASHLLTLEDEASKHTRNIYFYEKSTVPVETNVQAAIVNPAAQVWDWELEATTQWLAEFDAQCATPYINKIRGFFNRPKFASLQLQIGNDALELRYWYEDAVYAYNYFLPFKGNVTRTAKKIETHLFTANAKDLALVFAVLPTLPITSPNVQLAGNANLMRIKYNTELADYETYIPAADTAGARDATAFEMYGA